MVKSMSLLTHNKNQPNSHAQKTVYLVLDNPNRDLSTCLLIAYSLIQKSKEGILVKIIQMNYLPCKIFDKLPNYILFNYIRTNNITLIREISSCGTKIGILDTEGGVFTVLPKTGKLNFFLVLEQSELAQEIVTDYYCWGYKIFNALENEKKYINKLRLTGTPRSDFYSSRFDALYENDKNIILVNTSFSLINPKYSSFNTEKDMLIRKLGYDESYIDLLCEQTLQAKKRLVDDTLFLAKQLPSEKIIFRPHPFENELIYAELFKEHSNVEIRSDKTVDYWLRKAKFLIHFECSTAIEATCLNIPALSPAKMETIRPIQDANLCTTFYQNSEELLQYAKKILANDVGISKPESATEAIQNVYFKIDGNAQSRIADQILYSLSQTNKLSQERQLFYNIKWKLKLFLKYLINIKINLKKIPKDEVLRVSEKLNKIFSTEPNLIFESDFEITMSTNDRR